VGVPCRTEGLEDAYMVVIDEIKMTSTEVPDKGLVDALIDQDRTVDELIVG